MSQPSQHWCRQDYADNARFVADYGVSLLALLRPQPGEYSLDLGCGDGVLTRQIADAGCRVLGLDGSADLLAAARALGLEAVQGDGQRLDFQQEFDAVFSNAALHWMTDAEAVAAGIARALKPGGRLVAEFGGQGNVATIAQALAEALAQHGLNPKPCWYFPDTDSYRALLTRHGLDVANIALTPRPTPLPTGVTGWLAAFAAPMLPETDPATRAAVLAAAAELAESRLPRQDGQVLADYMRLRVLAFKPEQQAT